MSITITLYVQETLRIYTSVPDIIREASEDNILPLSKPIVGYSGKVYHKIFIPKGFMIHASPSGYNMYVCDSPEWIVY